ncbi:ATP-binding cassette domain-containing protein [Alkalihalobacterium alkalinitrilicum]|uniref:ATP-binding cassette domain-containing protein n=1 Tax=Alkalihalobacterium alkalinitrilicum TaxID=427920 RepID=UPI000994CF27
MNIHVKEVTKEFGAKKALDQLSVTFEEDKIYGLLGRNGAGKTTLMQCTTVDGLFDRRKRRKDTCLRN